MSRAVLEIDGDTSGLVAAFGAARKAAEDTERAAKRTGSAYRDNARAASAASRVVVAEAQRAVGAIVRAEEQKARAARMSADARKRAEQEATRIAQDEARKRGLSAEQEARVKQNALERFTRLYEAEERRQTAAAEREAAKRRQAFQRTFNEWRQFRVQEGASGVRSTVSAAGAVGQAASGAAGFASDAFGMIRDARRSRAGAERAIGNALFQAGGGRSDVQAAMATITRFAQDESIPTDTIATAMQAAQTEFSVLGDANTDAATRQQRISEFLDTVRLGRNTGNDPSEFARLAGLFQNQGFDATTTRNLLLFSAGAAQRGAVELGAITRQSMPAITARIGGAMARARVAGADPQAAAAAEYRQALAELEVARGTQGATPRDAGNALRNVTQALQGTVVQDRLRTNIETALGRNSALEQQLFEDDPTRRGERRLRAPYTNAVRLVEAFGAQGMSADQFMNITRGGGHGNPLSLLANERRVLGNLLNADAEGRYGYQRVAALSDPNVALKESDVARGAGIFRNDEQARIDRLEETRTNALTQNTGSVDRLTSALDRVNATNPILSKAAPIAGLGIVATLGAAKTATGAAVLAAGGGLANNLTAAFTGRDLQGNEVGLGERFLRAQTAAVGIIGGPLGGAVNAASGARDATRYAMSEQGLRAIETLPERIASAMQRVQITATVSPTDAAHAATQAPAPPTPAR